MLKALMDAWYDSLGMIPLLFVIYVALEFIERKYEPAIKKLIVGSTAATPLLGALFGCIPQCGFSVIASALYAQRVISCGTLLAVYLATSDEAIPVILAQPEKAGLIFPILMTKILIATVGGYGVDLILQKISRLKKIPLREALIRDIEKNHCCGKPHSNEDPPWKQLLFLPLWKTFQVFLFILAVSIGINFIILKAGEKNIGDLFLAHTIFQPILAVLVGLIPNCAASVMLTQLFLKGGISFGSAIGGLCASAGLGIPVLIKENKNFPDSLRIIALLSGISLLSGIILNFLF